MHSEKLLQFVLDHGYSGLFGLLALGVFGLPIPDECLMTLAGYLISQGKLTYSYTLLSSFLGSILGVTVTYSLGRYLGLPLIERYGKFIRVTPQKLGTMHNWFERYGRFALPIGYFFPGIRQLTAYFAGMTEMPFQKFSFYAYFGGLLWVTTFITLGTLLGQDWTAITLLVRRYIALLIMAGIFCIVTFNALRKQPKQVTRDEQETQDN
ncbi:MAG: DedA family protein [Firmicutes bacterium]|nr:DedA family protein [Bacillota bacterium]